MKREEIKTIVVIDGVNRNKRIYSPKTFEARVKKVRWCNSYSEQLQTLLWYYEVYGAKWTDNGLIYTHKMNAKGEFEEIDKSQEQIKAEAFDVLKSKIGRWHYKGDNLLVLKSMRDYVRLSQEQYEILKKAGLE